MKRLPASALVIALLVSACGDSSRVIPSGTGPPGEIETARRKAEMDHARNMRQRLIEYHEAGRTSYMEHVEERLRKRWPAGSAHETDFQNAMDGARRDYERMLQEQLRQLDLKPSPQGSLRKFLQGAPGQGLALEHR